MSRCKLTKTRWEDLTEKVRLLKGVILTIIKTSGEGLAAAFALIAATSPKRGRMRVDSRRRRPPSRSKHLPAICYRSAESRRRHEIAVKPSLSVLPVLFSRGKEVVKIFPRQPHFSPFLRLALSYLLSAPQVYSLPPESFHRRTDGRERGDTHRPVCGAACAHANAHKTEAVVHRLRFRPHP